MMHIAVDHDDVLNDFVGNLVNIINREYDAGLEIEDVNQWELSDILDPILGESWWDWWQRRDWLWALAPAMPGAIGNIWKLHRDGHYIEIVTAKPDWARPQLDRWLGKWRPYHDRLTVVGLGERKIDATEADLIIDDKVSTVEEWMAEGRKALLFARPHNVNERDEQKHIIVYGWNGTYQAIQSLTAQHEAELQTEFMKLTGLSVKEGLYSV
jgi:5'(3')-deoxyribonucleotidase